MFSPQPKPGEGSRGLRGRKGCTISNFIKRAKTKNCFLGFFFSELSELYFITAHSNKKWKKRENINCLNFILHAICFCHSS